MIDSDGGHNKSYLKAAQIARARVLGAAKGITDSEIARQFGLSTGGFARLIATPEYKEMETAVLSHVTTKQDAQLDGNLEALKKTFAKHIPAVMQSVLDVVMQKRDLKASLEAAKIWLDRDPARTLALDGHRSNGQGAASTPPLPDEVLRQLKEDSDSVISEVMGQPVTERVQ